MNARERTQVEWFERSWPATFAQARTMAAWARTKLEPFDQRLLGDMIGKLTECLLLEAGETSRQSKLALLDLLMGAGVPRTPGVLPSRVRPRTRSQAKVVPAKGRSRSPSRGSK